MANDSNAAALAGELPRPWVVVGVDASVSAKQAIRWAGNYRRLVGGTLLAVTACPDAGIWALSMPEVMDAQQRKSVELVGQAKANVEKIVSEVLGDDTENIVAHAVGGGVADALLDVSDGADLLVIGSTPRGALGRALVGPLRRGLLGRARCPIVLVPTDAN